MPTNWEKVRPDALLELIEFSILELILLLLPTLPPHLSLSLSTPTPTPPLPVKDRVIYG